MFGAAVLAATSKPTTVTLPCALLLLDYWPLGRMRSLAMLRDRVMEKLPFFGIAVVLSILTWIGQREAGATVSLTSMPLYYRTYNGVLSYAAYVKRSFWPGELSIFYPMHKIDSTDVWMAVGALLAITGVALWLARRFPYGIVGWLYFAGTLVPMIGLAQTGAQSMADRFTYIPAIGLVLVVVWAVADAAERYAVPRVALVAAGCAVCVALAVQSYRYTGFWTDSFTLFEHSVAVTEDNDFLHFNLTNMYINAGKLQQAAAHIEEGARIEPKLPEARILAAQVYSKMGNAPKAVEHLQVLRQLRPMDLGVQLELGSALWRMGRAAEARAEVDAVLKQAPNDLEARSLRLMMQ